MTRPLRYLAAIVLLAGTLAGCGATSDHALNLTLSALATPRANSTPSPPTKKVNCRHATASLRPPAALPAPNALPAGSFMAQIRKRGYLIAGVNTGAYKFGSLNPTTGTIEGFEIDLVNEVAAAIFGNASGHVRYFALTVPQRFTAVEDGRVDIVADTITITCPRRALVDFSTVYYNATQRLLVPRGSGVKDIQALAHKRVCATASSTPIDVMKAMSAADRPVPVGMPQAIDCLVALQQGTGNIAAISTDSSILQGFQAQDPNNTEIVGPSLGSVPYGMAISKAHPDFVRFVNGVLARLEQDGTWQRLQAEWLGQFHQLEATPTPEYDG
ncbi:MAG TPA: glutamate ABC transporter substrate-binding protein [Solirubrobacteraceae bacterium]|nr:glutamate ABC transporter substrate-binding protein [Solirubrobacteraceae bacterium]